MFRIAEGARFFTRGLHGSSRAWAMRLQTPKDLVSRILGFRV